MESDGEIMRKKDLLQKEIIDKKYDQTTFIDFCLSKKKNGDDLNEYTYEELESVVKEFVVFQQQKEDENQKKKELLEKEVIGKKYDQTTFINFCLSKKKNGDDLNEYTYDELESVIKEFIDSQKPVHKEDIKEDDKPKTEHI